MDLTDALTNYVSKKLEAVDKLVSEYKEVSVYVEIGKTTNHHKQGNYFKAEFDISIDGEKFFTVSEKSDLHKAIDDAKDQLINRIKNNKKRKNTLFKRGAASVKKMVKGISSRNPFTSKY